MALRILVIDDQPDQRGLMKLILSQAGYTVDTVGQAEDGISLARQTSYDAILIDFFLPDRNGIELAAALRRLAGHGTTPILMLSVERDSVLRVLGEQAGITCWLTKPVLREELVRTLERLLVTAGT